MENWRRRAAAPVEDRSRVRSRSHGLVAELPKLGIGEPDSTHSWTGTTCRAAPLACPDWSEERDVGRSRLDRVEGGRDNGKPGQTGRHARFAVTGVLICSVGVLVITARDIISHLFTLSPFKGLSRDQRTSLTMDDCMITSDIPNASLWQIMYEFTRTITSDRKKHQIFWNKLEKVVVNSRNWWQNSRKICIGYYFRVYAVIFPRGLIARAHGAFTKSEGHPLNILSIMSIINIVKVKINTLIFQIDSKCTGTA